MTSDHTGHNPAVRWQNVMAIAATGGFAGGGLLIGVSAGGRWLTLDPMVWQQGFWSEFVGFAVAIVPLFLLSFVGMYMSRGLDVEVPAARWWWSAGLVMWSVNFVITSVYHLPVNIQLYSVPFGAEEASSVRATWLVLHVPRVLLSIGTHLATVRASLIGSWASGAQPTQP